eukprot:TRINITY_DN9673_c0_g2_i1.p1 TRINITY_DN9673_c0_g2~~TRINITY_DN9673_c0_g2_i1.p1  ORF type:complete len:140 (-),score=26.71 TRINITY_DN9673_c0_g2_i1:153-572(-)
MIRRPPRSTQSRSSAASDVYKRQAEYMGIFLLKMSFYVKFYTIQGRSEGKIPLKVDSEAETLSEEASKVDSHHSLCLEIFDSIRTIRDPEHPYTIGELGLVELSNISIVDCDTGLLIVIGLTPARQSCVYIPQIALAIM